MTARLTPIAAPPRRRAAGIHAVTLTVLLGLQACATKPSDPEALAQYKQNDDPAEPTNRAIFAGNQFVDRNALHPVAKGYQDYVPHAVQRGVHNFLSNLEQPAILVNDALQGNGSRAWTTTQRFAINTVAGGAGLFDVATDWHRPGHAADFGQTLGVWGVGSGPAVQLPLFGPSNVRDSVGKVVGFVTDPVGLATASLSPAITVTEAAVGVVDGRAALLSTTDPLQKNALDYYATLRSVTAQHRADLVEQGKAGAVAPGPAGTPGPIKPVSVSVSPAE